MKLISKIYLKLLVFWSLVMMVWGVSGLFEYLTEIVPLIPLQNNAYPNGLQFLHWLWILLAGGIFFVGYFVRWKNTPYAMVVMFSNLATLCTIETFDFMSEQWGAWYYVIEMLWYVFTSVFLLCSTVSKSWFNLERSK